LHCKLPFLAQNQVNFSEMPKLSSSFYRRQDVVLIARELLGKVLVTRFDGSLTSGMIVETEAYEGTTDRASHAWGGRKTSRTEIMYGAGGNAYVYLCYGIHHLFNVVTNVKGVPHAVLVRALEPLSGVEVMLARCNKTTLDLTVTAGPGSLSKALGINHRLHTGESLTGKNIWIEDRGIQVEENAIVADSRVGVAYSGKDAFRPYRFYIRDNPWVSRGKGLRSR
jgi:DNA-3-methyladenine glycosylase